MANQNEYLEVVAFLPKRDGGKRAQRVGRAKINGDKVSIWLDVVPVGQGWDGSLAASPPREQQGQRGSAPAPRAAAPAADSFDDADAF